MGKPIDESQFDPCLLLLESMTLGGSKAVEAQEARGARQLHGATVLPTSGTEDAELWVKLGFKLGEPFPDDPLFRPAEFPAGWRITNNPENPDPRGMQLVDNRGRRRAYVFYKAAYYDRKASIRLVTRYEVCHRRYDPRSLSTEVLDNASGAAIPLEDPPRQENEQDWEYDRRIRTAAEATLIGRYPLWRDPAAYWE